MKKPLLLSTITVSLLWGQPLLADTNSHTPSVTSVTDEIGKVLHPTEDIAYIPYVFSSDSTGLTGGLGVIKQGLFQPQTTTIATLFYGTSQDIITNNQEDTANFSGGFATIIDYLVPGSDRLLFSAMGMKSYFPKARYYMYERSNDSDETDYVETSGDADFIYMTLKYVLPLGDGLDNPIGHYTLDEGFALGREHYGGGMPFVTGRTSLGISTFYEHNSFNNYLLSSPHSSKGVKAWDTNGLRFFLEHDNTDYDLNPSRGYQFKLQYSRDFGWADSEQSWDFLEFKYNHYINLPTFSFTKQNVLAMSFWTAYSFSWKEDNDLLDNHRPPPWEGARLGGLFRMRAYDQNRFSDKSAVYGTAEYRAILNWNPFKRNKYLPVAVDWLQVVGFVEAGRVHDTYNLDLLTDMKYDVGISLRIMAAQVPVRFDVAYGDEGTNFWVMVFQPFDF